MGTYLQQILPDKLRLDQLYVRNRSFASDLDIVFWTLAIFIPRIAKASIPEGLLFAGPFSRFAHRYVSWFLLDLLMAFASVSLAGLIWRMQAPFDWGWKYMALLACGLALLFSMVNYLAGLDRIVWASSTAEDAIGLFFTAGLVTLTALVLNHLQAIYHWLPLPSLPVELILTLGLMAQCGFIFARYRLRLLAWVAEGWLSWRRNAPGTGERVLILGDGETSQIANWLLRRGMFRHAFSVVGIVAANDPTQQGMRLNGCWVVGGVGDLPALIQRYDVRMVVYTLSNAAGFVRDMVFTLSRNASVRLVFLDDLLGFVHQQLDRPAVAHEYLEWLQQRTEDSAFRDGLTELPNAALLQERVRHSLACARRYNARPALMIIDLNGLDSLNGSSGPKTEEDLLKAVALRLKGSKRESDTLARVKEHQFALLLENVPDESAAEIIIKRTMTLMTDPFLVRGREISVTADIGIYLPAEDLEGVKELRHCNLGHYYAGWRRPRNAAFERLA
jgi:diguanylate cyclase (GGDEF)-like protein